MKRLLPLLVLLGWISSLTGQSWSLETTIHRGRILKHTPRITYPIPASSNGLTVEWLYQTDGNKDWQEHHGYPLFGLAFRYYHLGDANILGHAIGLYPNLHLTLVNQPRWSMHFTVGSGLAVLTRSFDRLDNPLNNAIGSSVNNITAFALRFNFRLNDRLSLVGQGSFTHFSNAATSLPNLGINIPALAIGARYYPQRYSEKRLSGHSKMPTRRWGGFAFSGIGFKETALPGGAKWPIYFSSVGVLYR
ncbi:MAG: acyloxyacyl hydrolase, partial [Bacteroidota bacterium]